MYVGNIEIKVAKLKRGWGIVSGYNILRRFKTEQEAVKEVQTNFDFYAYWAKSASSNIINQCSAGQVKTRVI